MNQTAHAPAAGRYPSTSSTICRPTPGRRTRSTFARQDALIVLGAVDARLSRFYKNDLTSNILGIS